MSSTITVLDAAGQEVYRCDTIQGALCHIHTRTEDTTGWKIHLRREHHPDLTMSHTPKGHNA